MTRHTLCVALAVYAAVSPVRAAPLALMVNDAGDAGDGTCTTACTLRDAIASVADGGTITFDPALLPATITLQKGELDISKGVNILGPGAGALAISGAGSSRLIFIDGSGGPVAIADVTLRDGAVIGSNGTPGANGNPGDAGGDTKGGCIYVGVTVLSLERVSIRHCTAQAGDGGAGAAGGLVGGAGGGAGGSARGGAIYLAGNLLLDETSIIDAHAQAGAGGNGGNATTSAGNGGPGGSAFGGGIYLDGSADMWARNVTLAAGSATGGNGGSGGNNVSCCPGGRGGDGGNADGGLASGYASLAIFDFATLAQGGVVAGGAGARGANTYGSASGQAGSAHGGALSFISSTGQFGATAIFASTGALSCYGDVIPSTGAGNLADDPSCGTAPVAALAAAFRPLAENAAFPHYMPVYGSVVVDAATTCTDYHGDPVPTDGESTLRPQGPACDVGAIEADYVFVGEFD